jgi:hypothetical protein
VRAPVAIEKAGRARVALEREPDLARLQGSRCPADHGKFHGASITLAARGGKL